MNEKTNHPVLTWGTQIRWLFDVWVVRDLFLNICLNSLCGVKMLSIQVFIFFFQKSVPSFISMLKFSAKATSINLSDSICYERHLLSQTNGSSLRTKNLSTIE
eukprot:UN24294